MGPSLSDGQWNVGSSDSVVFRQIKDGRGAMPAYKDHLSDTEIWKTVAFIRTVYGGPKDEVNW